MSQKLCPGRRSDLGVPSLPHSLGRAKPGHPPSCGPFRLGPGRKSASWAASSNPGPEPRPTLSRADGEIVRVARLGGLINEYHEIAA
jgi:hypothetical protein